VIESGVKEVVCNRNKLTELHVPGSVERINCTRNALRLLEIEFGVKYVDCHSNLLTELCVPGSVKTLICNRGVVNPQEFVNSNIYIQIV
jgi:hypothetical protein